MSENDWDVALRAAAHALGLGMWRIDFGEDLASLDPIATELLCQRSPESADDFIRWLEDGVGDGSLPRWSEDAEWVSHPVHFRGPDGRRFVRFAGRREGRIWQGSVQNITQEHMLRERVAQAERMEAIGQFSAGVAHNFNNMLAIIAACLSHADAVLAREDAADPNVVRDIRDAQDAADRAALVVGQLARLAHADRDRAEMCEVQPLCINAIEGLRRVGVKGLSIVHAVPPNLYVKQSPGVLEQVLSNLLNNANYAVRDRENPTIWLCGTQSEAFGVPTLELVISDNGTGISPEIEETLFQPFMTSKGAEGTGLGLATACESLRQMDGQLMYRPREEGGAEFVVLLPLVPAPIEPKPFQRLARPISDNLEGCRVLIVDDEPVIVLVVQRILEEASAVVTTADTLASAHAQLTPVHDVVLLDQTLGRERGIDLLPHVRTASSATRVLLFSGEPVEPEVASRIEGVVAKPIRGPALVDVIKRVMATETKT